MHQHTGEPVGLRQRDQPDDGGKKQAVLEGKAEQIGFLAHQPGGGAGDGDRLRRDHLAGHAAAGIGGDQQHIADADLMCSGGLQRAEQCVGRGVGTCQENPQPAEEGREEWEGRISRY